MKVKDLIKKLQEENQELEIVFWNELMDDMPKFTIIQTYKMQDIWKNVEAKNKEEAVDICMAGRDVDENNPDYTNDIIEIYQEELHYVGGEK